MRRGKSSGTSRAAPSRHDSVASRWGWCGARSSPAPRCRPDGRAANAAYKSSKTKKAPLCRGAFFDHREELYFFLVVFVVLVVLVVVVLDAAGFVVVVVESIFIVVSTAAGAGAIAGAAVSAVADSSFLEHAASTRTAATRARRFIYDLLWRLTWNKSPVRARDRDARFWRGRKFISSESCVKGRAVWLPSDAGARLTRK